MFDKTNGNTDIVIMQSFFIKLKIMLIALFINKNIYPCIKSYFFMRAS